MDSSKSFKLMSALVLLLALITSVFGLFWKSGGSPFYVTNIYGSRVEMYGSGLYAFDTYFKAPIQRGTDFITLFLAIPVLACAIFFNKKNTIKHRLLLVSVLSYFLYYSASLCFSVSYNKLILVYIVFFSASLFSFMIGITGINANSISGKILDKMPRRSIAIFMIFAGLSVFIWLAQILSALPTGKPPVTLAIYTTEPTYIFDLGIIAPSAFACAAMLFHNNPLGYIYGAILLVLNSFIGAVVISQTIFQSAAGISSSAGYFISGIFVVVSTAALLLNVKLLKNIEN